MKNKYCECGKELQRDESEECDMCYYPEHPKEARENYGVGAITELPEDFTSIAKRNGSGLLAKLKEKCTK